MTVQQPKFFSRRDLLFTAGTGFFAGVVASALPTGAEAATNLTADQALERLVEGNKRWIQFKLTGADRTKSRLAEVAKGQSPFAAFVSCADSRVPAELIFDQGLGDLFMNRVAGNVLDEMMLGSLEFATSVLGAPLVVVMGHQRCGAVQAAVKAVTEGTQFPGHLANFVDAIRPAAASIKGMPGDAVENAIRANVLITVDKIKTAPPIISKLVEQGKVKVVGARYDLDTGAVSFY
ncbi:carbonic anhydrase [Gloeobacter morelensis]|uniref:carbonic anhydrase n=1 Tax=Gloeobacter morelensis MG652769 TaxID=2781736 RepID=A0ABY3PG87_9CYAN|nr:carbonic anhydrase [Gloeobacter morelensis]UFP92659.1 carbonic anhydrase [Gloeobacter morelensis MG652769]